MRWQEYLALLGIGFVLGAMLGMSASPVTGIVLAGLVVLVFGFAAVAAGLAQKYKESDVAKATKIQQLALQGLRPIPLLFLVLGIGAGTMGGLFARTHSIFSPSTKSIVEEWSRETGYEKEVVARRLFDHRYPEGAVSVSKGVFMPLNHQNSVLFSNRAAYCELIAPFSGAELRVLVEGAPDLAISLYADIIEDDKKLESIMRKICSQ